ncbi:MAG TPA: hypothetical protein VGM93_12920, partial [Acidimicrobiales bacterium]
TDRSAARFGQAVTVFAGGTTLFWLVRLPMILSDHHPAAFNAVHTVLAVVSVVAAWSAWRSIQHVDATGHDLTDRPLVDASA